MIFGGWVRTPQITTTPAYVVRLPVVRANASRMLATAERLGVALRPHVKSHKTLELGELQTGGSKRGITVSTHVLSSQDQVLVHFIHEYLGT
eukprot:SAG11_NODE_2533_length_3246_cov_40.379409_1_plen_92_part_00